MGLLWGILFSYRYLPLTMGFLTITIAAIIRVIAFPYSLLDPFNHNYLFPQ